MKIEPQDVQELLALCLEEMDVDDMRRALKEMSAKYSGCNHHVPEMLNILTAGLAELTGTVAVL